MFGSLSARLVLGVAVGLGAMASGALALPAPLPSRVGPSGLPLSFERNTGHCPKQVQFVACTRQGALFLTRTEAVLALRGKGKAATLRMRLQGAGPASVAQGVRKLPGVVNYLIGKDPTAWRTRVPTYSGVRFTGVYKGIDLVYYAGKGQALEYDFVVKPGADPRQIRVAVSGARSLRSEGGKVIASTACGDVTLNRPYAYQTVGGVRRQVACAFTLERNTVAFQVARYDASRPLVVDPTLEYSTYLGGSNDDQARAVAVDAAGSAYLAGSVISTNFPTTDSGYRTGNSGIVDAFVTKFNPAGSALVYSTYLGGAQHDEAFAIAVDSAGAAYITGYTRSSDYPTTAGAYDTSRNGGDRDVVATKLTAEGSALEYSTLFGGSVDNYPMSIAVDAAGAAYITGLTMSSDFPTTPGAFDPSYNGEADGFVTKVNPTGTALTYSTFLGDTSYDYGAGIAVDAAGAAYITGCTWLIDSLDIFVVKLIPDGAALEYGTNLGGSGDDLGAAIAVDAAGDVYVTGSTTSRDLPVTPGAFSSSFSSLLGYVTDGFVAKLEAGGTVLSYCTYLGGGDYDEGSGIAVDGSGCAYVVGTTSSWDFPTTPDAYNASWNSSYEVFLTKLNASGTAMQYSTYFGGTGYETGVGMAMDSTTAVYICGMTRSPDYPTTTGAYSTSPAGDLDAFACKFAWVQPTAMVATGATGQVGEMVEVTATLTSSGSGVSGATVKFTMPNGVTTSRTTDASGVANLWYDIPAGAVTGDFTAAFEATAAYTASSATGALTVDHVARVQALPATGKQGAPVTLGAYLWQGKAMAGITGQQLTYKIDGGPAANFATLTAGTYGKATSAYAIPAAMAAGAHTITVDWAGGGNYPAAQGSSTLTVQAASLRTCIWVHNHGANVGIPTRLTCYLYEYRRNGDLIPLAGKPVALSAAGTLVATVNTAADGKATTYYTPAASGAVAQSMTFAGDATYSASAGSGTLTVAP